MINESITQSFNKYFNGPLFIIGISRSGTKLLRDLLNNHSKISLTKCETKFIPSFYRHFKNWSNEKIMNDFSTIYKSFLRTKFYSDMKKTGNLPSREIWFNKVETWSIGGVIKSLLKYPTNLNTKNIWGDKTPNYLIHIPILKTIFPDAKFIHITRDVRDVCISAFKAWRRNYYYTAQCWNDYISQCRKDADDLSDSDYLEIKYEDLIEKPEYCMSGLCAFVGVAFEKKMCRLKNPSENIGDTKGEVKIIDTNTGKWKTQLNSRELKKIETICAPILLESGYSLSHAYPKKIKRINPLLMYLYYFKELLYIFKNKIKNNNFVSAINTIIQKYRFRTTSH